MLMAQVLQMITMSMKENNSATSNKLFDSKNQMNHYFPNKRLLMVLNTVQHKKQRLMKLRYEC